MLGLNAWRNSVRSVKAQSSKFVVARYSQLPPSSSSTSSPTKMSAMLEDVGDGPPTSASAQFSEDGPPKSSSRSFFSELPTKKGPIRTTMAEVHRRQTYRLHCHSSRNNTITTFTKPDGSPLSVFTGGSCGFKRGQRATYEAGYQCVVRAFEKIREVNKDSGPIYLELFLKGFGQGREALQKALSTTEGEFIRDLVTRVTDRTPIKIGGTRSQKARRL